MAYKFSSDQNAFEFRGVRDLVFSEVLLDTDEDFICGAVYKLSPVAKITRSTENSSDAHYYDNQPLIVITSTGKDELGLTVAPMDLQTYAMVTGQVFDSETGSLIEGERESKYFAIGYITKGTDGKERYVWRYKGMFSIPDEENNTEDDGTDTTNTELTWTGVATVHKFAKNNNKPIKALVCDERYDCVDFDTFFDDVKTPDTLEGRGLSGVATPKIFPTSTAFSTQIRVSIVCDTPNAKIYYTTDGTTPSSGAGSTEYTEPFNITKTTTITAYAIANGLKDSIVVTKNFIAKSTN
jgi:phi13 family phage major tail protein